MLLLAACFVLLLAADRASASTYVVDTAIDDPLLNTCDGGANNCSLRGAIDKADDDVTTDILNFSVASVTIDSPLPQVQEKLTVNGGGTTVVGSLLYTTSCLPSEFAFDLTAAQVALFRLPIYNVCQRAIKSNVPAPTISVGPRRSDNTVSLNGAAVGASVDIYEADPPANGPEASGYFDSVVAINGGYARVLTTLPATGDEFTATTTDSSGRTSGFAVPAATPPEFTSPVLNNAVAIANNEVRLDFNEAISGSINGAVGAFTLKMGTANRQITSVGVSGNSVYVGSATTPWAAGEAGQIFFTGGGRVADVFGNEVLGEPTKTVFGGPGKLTQPVISKFRTSPSKFCQRKTSKCRRGQTYLYITLSEDARVVFNVYRQKGRKFVVRYVRKLPKGTSKTRLFGTINGRTLPATSLLVNAVAEDTARNYSAPVDARFKVVTRKNQL
jgi:hypothetical protein